MKLGCSQWENGALSLDRGKPASCAALVGFADVTCEELVLHSVSLLFYLEPAGTMSHPACHLSQAPAQSECRFPGFNYGS